MLKKLSAVLLITQLTTIPAASAQHLAVIPYGIAQYADWDMKEAQVLSQPLSSLSAQDQAGILHLLGGKPEELRAMRLKTASSHIFLRTARGFRIWL